jgi:apolipoprotein N-acyltransferase
VKTAAAGIFSGVLLVLSFPRSDFSLTAWVALVPLLYHATRATPRQALASGAILGVVFHLGNLYWISEVMVRYGGLGRPVSIAVLAALVGYLTLFTMTFGGLTAVACRWGGPRGLLAAPVLWVGLEFFKNFPWGGFPWCLLGYSQVRVAPVVQIASVTGIYGISLLVVWVNALVAYWLSGPGWKRAVAAGAPVAMVLTGVMSYGYVKLSEPLPEATYPVTAVQANVAQEHKWDAGYGAKIFADHMRLSAEAAANGSRLIVWPESSTPFLFDQSPVVAGEMRAFAGQAGVYLLFGSDDYETLAPQEGGGIRAYNGAKLISPEGDVGLRYRKIVLVPFGEYVPMRSIFSFAESLMEGVSDFSSGTEVLVAPVDGAKLGAFICYEAIYPDLVRRFVGKGAGLLVNLTNDAWFGETSAPFQHFNMVVARAVETRRYLVRAANTGISAIVDPYGRVLTQSNLFTQQVVSGKVSFRSDETYFVRYGNLVAHSSAVATLLFGLAVVVFFLREKKITQRR